MITRLEQEEQRADDLRHAHPAADTISVASTAFPRVRQDGRCPREGARTNRYRRRAVRYLVATKSPMNLDQSATSSRIRDAPSHAWTARASAGTYHQVEAVSRRGRS